MRSVIPHPCMGARLSALRMSMSSMPWIMSPDGSACGTTVSPLDRREKMPALLSIVKRTPDHGRFLSSGLESLDRIAVGILDLDLTASRSRFHLVAEIDSGLF